MKAIVLKGRETITLNVEYYKTGHRPANLWLATLTGRVEYTVEDLGDFRCVLRRHRAFHIGPVEETRMDLEYGTGDVLQLGMALTPQKHKE